jgi:hypothetical protein
MKLYLLIALMILLLYSNLQGQTVFKLKKPTDRDLSCKRLYSLQISDSSLVTGDTLNKVIRVYFANDPVVFYNIQITKDSASLSVYVNDSSILDTSRYQQLLVNDSLRNSRAYRLLLTGSDDVGKDFPISGVFQYYALPVPPVKAKLDTILKQKPLTVHGSITIIGQYADNKYTYQTIPQNYVRGYANVNAELFGLPFSTGYGYSTESNTGLNKINNFRLSFNHDQFYQQIKVKLDKKIEASKAVHLKELTHIDIGSLDAELKKLERELMSKDFKRKIERNKSVIDMGETDTSFRKSYKYKKALSNQAEYKDRLARLRELEKLKKVYSRLSELADIDANISRFKLNRPKDFRKASKRFGYVKPGQSIFLSLKKIDLGTFDPGYTALVLGGINLTGVNIEMNPGYIYGAFTWGKAISNITNPFDYKAMASGRNIMSIRIGLGNKDKFLVAMSFLRGVDDLKNVNTDSLADYTSPKRNYVIGMDLRYKFTSNADLGLEYAKSYDQSAASDAHDLGKDVGKLVDPDRGRYSNAFNAFSNFNIGSRTRFKILSRWVDPFFNSFGTPYLRKDNFRVELKGEQSLWKERLGVSLTYRRDADNLYHFKQGSSLNSSYIFNAKLRIPRYPYLLLTYSPNYQASFFSETNQQIYNRVEFYNAIIGYTYLSAVAVINSAFTYVKQLSTSNQEEVQAIDMNQFGLNENVNIPAFSITLNGTASYTLPMLRGDTGKIAAFSLSCTKGIFKNKATVMAGGRYSKDFSVEERYIAEAGTSFGVGFGLNFQVNLERHFIYSLSSAYQEPSDMFQGRITIIKTF